MGQSSEIHLIKRLYKVQLPGNHDVITSCHDVICRIPNSNSVKTTGDDDVVVLADSNNQMNKITKQFTCTRNT